MSLAPRPISTGATTFWKSVFTPGWIALFGSFTAALWLGLVDGSPSLALKLAATGVWVGMSAFLVHWSRRLAHVWIQGTDLRVRTTGGERRIPLSEVREIRESRFQRVKLITLELQREVPGVGREIVFPAPLTLQRPFGEHPLVAELKALKRVGPGDAG